MTDRSPTYLLAHHTLIQDISIFCRIRMERQGLRDVCRRDWHFERSPRFPSIFRAVVGGLFGYNKGVAIVKRMLKDHAGLASWYTAS